MAPILLFSKDLVVITQYEKLARQLNAPLKAVPPGTTRVRSRALLLVDADSWPANPQQRSRLVELLCRRAASAPVGCFGYLLTEAQRAALDAAGVHVTRGPGRTLLRTLAFWRKMARAGSTAKR
jgi:hypothetical protein